MCSEWRLGPSVVWNLRSTTTTRFQLRFFSCDARSSNSPTLLNPHASDFPLDPVQYHNSNESRNSIQKALSSTTIFFGAARAEIARRNHLYSLATSQGPELPSQILGIHALGRLRCHASTHLHLIYVLRYTDATRPVPRIYTPRAWFEYTYEYAHAGQAPKQDVVLNASSTTSPSCLWYMQRDRLCRRTCRICTSGLSAAWFAFHLQGKDLSGLRRLLCDL